MKFRTPLFATLSRLVPVLMLALALVGGGSYAYAQESIPEPCDIEPCPCPPCPPEIIISGHVRNPAGAGLSGVQVRAVRSNGVTFTTQTDNNGYYEFDFFVFNPGAFTYTVTPSKPGYTFSPPSRAVGGFGDDGVDFMGRRNHVPSDFDGDGKTDIAVYRPSTGIWQVIYSSNNQYVTQQLGASGEQPAPGDYDGDGKTDFAMFHPSTGTWTIKHSSNGQIATQQWGLSGDLPTQRDYDGDGKTDIAIFRPSNNTWWILRSSNGASQTAGWGLATDKLTPSDYDGDGKTDIAIFRPSDTTWWIAASSLGNFVQPWNQNGNVPVPGDYDGDGKTDVAVFSPGTGRWYVLLSSTGTALEQTLGAAGDIPIPTAYLSQ